MRINQILHARQRAINEAHANLFQPMLNRLRQEEPGVAELSRTYRDWILRTWSQYYGRTPQQPQGRAIDYAMLEAESAKKAAEVLRPFVGNLSGTPHLREMLGLDSGKKVIPQPNALPNAGGRRHMTP